jgi:hypothetical protein
MITIILDGKEDKVASLLLTYSTEKETKTETLDSDGIWKLLQTDKVLDGSCKAKYKYDTYNVRDIFKNEYDELVVRLYS